MSKKEDFLAAKNCCGGRRGACIKIYMLPVCSGSFAPVPKEHRFRNDIKKVLSPAELVLD